MNRQFKDAIWKAGFKPVEDAADLENRLRVRFGLTTRYDPARLAIGRSLAETTPPPPLDCHVSFGKPIAGEHLLGQEVDLWMSALILDGGLGSEATVDDFRALVEAHWARGTRLLRDDLEGCGDDDAKFVTVLADFLPEVAEDISGLAGFPTTMTGEVRLTVGDVSKTYPGDLPVTFSINGPGDSPHIALMGKVGSGKTTTGINLAQQIIEQANIPFLFIDPKGEFVDGEDLVGRLADTGVDIEPIEVGRTPIPLDFLPGPSVGSVSIQNAAMRFRDSIVLCCKGAGNIQQDLLRTAMEKVIRYAQSRDLESVKEYYKEELDAHQKGHDSIMSRLSELTSIDCFVPSMPASEFFRRSWVLSLRALETEELKRLVILLVIDALKAFVLSQSDAPVADGYRGLRHLLVIDEARRILAEKKYASLADLVRQGRAKGAVVMLLSQDPSDFEGQVDDFTTQLGTCISFACSQTQHGLRALQGVYGRKVQSSEFSDTYLPKGVAFTKLPGRHAERILCWE